MDRQSEMEARGMEVPPQLELVGGKRVFGVFSAIRGYASFEVV